MIDSAATGGGVQLTFGGLSSVGSGDFDGDGRRDVILLATNSALTVARGQSNGSFVEQSSLAANTLDARWSVAGIGDFNGDGRSDILWRHHSGVIGQWSGQIGQFSNNSGVAANAVGNDWTIVGVADFNGDGRADILWRHSSGELGQWLAQPNGSFNNNGGAAANVVDPSWTVVATRDFNGDGKADLLWRHASGAFAEWQGTGSGKLVNAGAVMAGATGSVVGAGDFTADGKDDIVMRHPATGVLTMWQAQDGGTFAALKPLAQVNDLNWKILTIGDFNGDGRDDLLWRHNSGATTEWLSLGSGEFGYNGAAMSLPIGWDAETTGVWLV